MAFVHEFRSTPTHGLTHKKENYMQNFTSSGEISVCSFYMMDTISVILYFLTHYFHRTAFSISLRQADKSLLLLVASFSQTLFPPFHSFHPTNSSRSTRSRLRVRLFCRMIVSRLVLILRGVRLWVCVWSVIADLSVGARIWLIGLWIGAHEFPI